MSNEFDFEPAVLVLADGRAFRGRSVGAAGSVVGKLRFDTEQCGYFAALTDAKNTDVLLAFTTPHIGNTGVADPQLPATVAGVIMRDPSRCASHWDSAGELEPYLAANETVAISHIDTRALIRHAGAHHEAELRDPIAIATAITSAENTAKNTAENTIDDLGATGNTADHTAEKTAGNTPEVAAGIFAGEQARTPLTQLIEIVRTTAKEKGL